MSPQKAPALTPDQSTGLPEILTSQELADVLGIHPATLRRLVAQGRAPAHFLVGSKRRWRRNTVLNWAAGQERKAGRK